MSNIIEETCRVQTQPWLSGVTINFDSYHGKFTAVHSRQYNTLYKVLLCLLSNILLVNVTIVPINWIYCKIYLFFLFSNFITLNYGFAKQPAMPQLLAFYHKTLNFTTDFVLQVRKKAMQQQAQQNLQDVKTHCTSEPRLNETETPQTHRRYGSTRRATHNSGESRNVFSSSFTTSTTKRIPCNSRARDVISFNLTMAETKNKEWKLNGINLHNFSVKII